MAKDPFAIFDAKTRRDNAPEELSLSLVLYDPSHQVFTRQKGAVPVKGTVDVPVEPSADLYPAIRWSRKLCPSQSICLCPFHQNRVSSWPKSWHQLLDGSFWKENVV